MNKVITINLGGTAYQLEEGGYDVLRAYLETATARLQGNPDRDEILLDIERAIAEKFRSLLGSYKTVVVTKEVTAVLAEMGPIEAESGEAANPGASAGAPSGEGERGTAGEERAAAPRRLYRIHEGAMIAGVCNGIAAYVNMDPTLVRLAFVLLTMVWGTGVLVYIVMAIVVPEALSPEEKAAASGAPSTAQEFIRRAKEGYYEAMKGFPDRKAHREWKRRFKREMRGWSRSFGREMRANADQWRHHWAEQAPVYPGMGFALPLLSLLHGVATILWICALIALLATGTMFGLPLPTNVPVWLAAVLLFVTYGIIASPLKVARRACYGSFGQPRCAWSFVFFLEALVSLGIVIVLLWLAAHYFPEVREAIQSIPSLAHQAAGDIQAWCKGK
jgi:phage shock protein PspC (stress-responsive transcriptional regulator)